MFDVCWSVKEWISTHEIVYVAHPPLFSFNHLSMFDSSQKRVRMLVHAARRGDLSMFEYLVERGADITSEDEQPEDVATSPGVD